VCAVKERYRAESAQSHRSCHQVKFSYYIFLGLETAVTGAFACSFYEFVLDGWFFAILPSQGCLMVILIVTQ